MRYRVFLAEEVWDFLDSQEVNRAEFAALLRALPEYGDFEESNPVDGRQLQIKIVGDYAITYYFDHPVSEIKILEVEKADF